MGSPNSEDECVILGISWSLWPMQKDFGGAYSSFSMEPPFHAAKLCLPQNRSLLWKCKSLN